MLRTTGPRITWALASEVRTRGQIAAGSESDSPPLSFSLGISLRCAPHAHGVRDRRTPLSRGLNLACFASEAAQDARHGHLTSLPFSAGERWLRRAGQERRGRWRRVCRRSACVARQLKFQSVEGSKRPASCQSATGTAGIFLFFFEQIRGPTYYFIDRKNSETEPLQ